MFSLFKADPNYFFDSFVKDEIWVLHFDSWEHGWESVMTVMGFFYSYYLKESLQALAKI